MFKGVIVGLGGRAGVRAGRAIPCGARVAADSGVCVVIKKQEMVAQTRAVAHP